MTCQHSNCQRTLVVECLSIDLENINDDFDKLTPSEKEQVLAENIAYYCPFHCREHGFCWHCGFYFGSAALSLYSGLCNGCESQMDLHRPHNPLASRSE